jgi:GT2 family glycosyltransferase/MoaA/NifB/PqqE/SkfB family radical SAM enzyme
MDFGLFQSVVRQLQSPEIIRLNYSGESVHYPRLLEAIRLAHETGAFTELVSAFASYPRDQVERLATSGLDRLTVSLHTLDEAQFTELYRFSSLAQLRQMLAFFRECQQRLGSAKPILDFAFVALHDNLGQLGPIAKYARELGIRQLSVHPVIRRNEIPAQFNLELLNNRLRPEFKKKLEEEVRSTAARVPEVEIIISTPELKPDCPLDSRPRRYTGPLPAVAQIYSCDQNPWETVHILANGDVVVCEVQDQIPLGNLKQASLAEIWKGTAYREFRRKYRAGEVAACRTCSYKLAYFPASLSREISGSQDNSAQLVTGWHQSEGGLIWSKQSSVAIMPAGPQGKWFFLEGVLPPSHDGKENRLTVLGNGRLIGTVSNRTADHKQFEMRARLSRPEPFLRLEFQMSQAYRPAAFGAPDVRELGFALRHLEVSRNGRRLFSQGEIGARLRGLSVRGALALRRTSHRLLAFIGGGWARLSSARIATRIQAHLRELRSHPRLFPLYVALLLGRATSHLLAQFPRKHPLRHSWQPGVSIIVPERSTARLLEDCLAAAVAAAEKLDEPAEFIVVVNGSPLSDYRNLAEKFPAVRWLHSPRPLGFQSAIAKGIRQASYDWVYLLNSDMILELDALKEVMKWRADHVFAIASQIFFADASRRREETGWTDFRIGGPEGVEIFDVTPDGQDCVRGHLYAGGGSSLFRRKALSRMMVRRDPYHPFYWEDVEWGVRAWCSGYEVLFCPRSRAIHVHRATISQFYEPDEVDRVFRRNATQFDLRNRFSGASLLERLQRIGSRDSKTRTELCSFRNAISLFRALCWNARAPYKNIPLHYSTKKFYLQPVPHQSARPKVLVVAPFAVCPPVHGGARRIISLLKHLAKKFDIVFLSDEESLCSIDAVEQFCGPIAVHLVGGRPAPSRHPESRIERIQTHSHELLRTETRRIAACYGVDLVQIEHVELAALIESRSYKVPWFLTLHDVLLRKKADSPEDQFEEDLISRYSGVIVCSPEDARLVEHPATRIVPNGVEVNGWRPSRGNRSILFAGPFRYHPNLEGIRLFLEKVYPLLLQAIPDLQLEILGGRGAEAAARKLECFQQRGVQVHDSVKSIHPWYEYCALTINPLYGIRGSSIKLLESLAAGRVCVSTVDGARGFSNLPLSSLIVRDRVDDFVEPIRMLLLDETSRLRLERPDMSVLSQLEWGQAAAAQGAFYLEHLGYK